jgi:hypothetical protein
MKKERTSRSAVILALLVVIVAMLALAPAALAAEKNYLLGSVYGSWYNSKMPLGPPAWPHAAVEVVYWDGTQWVPYDNKLHTLDISGFYAFSIDLGAVGEYYDLYAMMLTTDNAAFPLTPPWSAMDPIGFANSPGNFTVISFDDQVLPTMFSGTVKNSKTRKGIKGVKVTCAGKSVKTKAKGKYTLGNLLLKPGTAYKIKFTKKGYVTKGVSKKSSPGATTIVNVRMRKK